MKKIKVGIVGMGYIGESHIEAVRRIGFCELYAVADTNAALARTKAEYYGIEKCYDSLDALLADPELIVLDEPSMGLSPLLVSEIFEIVKSFKEAGKTVLLVEQNAKKAMSVSDRVYVLETGSRKMSGNAKGLINDPNIKKAYLGE